MPRVCGTRGTGSAAPCVAPIYNEVEQPMNRPVRGRAIAAGFLALGTAITLAGCGASGGDSASSSSSDSKGTVGLVEFDTTSPIDAEFANGAREALKKDGWQVLSQDPKGDPGQANTICT